MGRQSEWITAAQASRMLRLHASTLNSYVTGGYIRSAPADRGEQVRYFRQDVASLRVRAAADHQPEQPTRWELPEVQSGAAAVHRGQLLYRGYDACELAASTTLEEVASLLWTGSFDAAVSDSPLHVIAGGAGESLPFASRALAVLPMVAAGDPLASSREPLAVAQTGWRILNLLASVAADTQDLAVTVEETLVEAWSGAASRTSRKANAGLPGLLRAALIVSAGQPLDASSLTARLIASAGADPYAAIAGALAAFAGERSGGELSRIESMLSRLSRARDRSKALSVLLSGGAPLDGFGHPLYPKGDPRAAALLTMLPQSRELTFAHDLAAAVEDLAGVKPNLAFALVVMQRTQSLPAGAAFTLSAIGRSIGWLAHAIDQYGSGVMLRPRLGSG